MGCPPYRHRGGFEPSAGRPPTWPPSKPSDVRCPTPDPILEELFELQRERDALLVQKAQELEEREGC